MRASRSRRSTADACISGEKTRRQFFPCAFAAYIARSALRSSSSAFAVRDTATGGDRQLLGRDDDRLPQNLEDALGDLGGFVAIGEVVEQNCELVTAETGSRVFDTKLAGETLAHVNKELVARPMA